MIKPESYVVRNDRGDLISFDAQDSGALYVRVREGGSWPVNATFRSIADPKALAAWLVALAGWKECRSRDENRS